MVRSRIQCGYMLHVNFINVNSFLRAWNDSIPHFKDPLVVHSDLALGCIRSCRCFLFRFRLSQNVDELSSIVVPRYLVYLHLIAFVVI